MGTLLLRMESTRVQSIVKPPVLKLTTLVRFIL